MTNRLQSSKSAYLQQHKNNPVDWYPWGEEALKKSRTENRPIFLSIGYSSCHWCHVMEKESFSSDKVAEILNSSFVPIKVDREERPDLDHIYMQAVQLSTGSGGWPLNVFLTPDLRPFFGGTYFPSEAKYGRPAFRDLLLRVAEIYSNQQDEVRKNADQLTAMLIQESRFFKKTLELDQKPFEKILKNIKANFEAQFGGFGAAPKFFYTYGLRLILLEYKETKDLALRQMLDKTLTLMAQGGVYDQVGGGFHRYSTDLAWKVPHFEKMLYDNALLARVYLEAWELTQNSYYQEIVEEILDWTLREMSSPQALLYSAIDADTEHEEGLFYTWTYQDLKSHFSSSEFEKILEACELSETGNFEGRNILYFKANVASNLRSEVKKLFKSLRANREKRDRPFTDTKSICSWNALMISSFAFAGKILKSQKYFEVSKRISEMWWLKREASKLSHSVVESESSKDYFLEDYAYFLESQMDLWDLSAESIYRDRAVQLADELIEIFSDKTEAGFWAVPEGRTDLLYRYKEIFDGALPAPYHLAVNALLRLWNKTAEPRYFEVAEKALQCISGTALEAPGGFNSYALSLKNYFKFLEIGCQGPDCKIE